MGLMSSELLSKPGFQEGQSLQKGTVLRSDFTESAEFKASNSP